MYSAGAAIMLMPLLALSEAMNGEAVTDCEERHDSPNSCTADASGQPKVLVQVRGTLREDLNADFDCVAGVKNWQAGWSSAKKEWCCIHEEVGCEYDCKEGLDQ